MKLEALVIGIIVSNILAVVGLYVWAIWLDLQPMTVTDTVLFGRGLEAHPDIALAEWSAPLSSGGTTVQRRSGHLNSFFHTFDFYQERDAGSGEKGMLVPESVVCKANQRRIVLATGVAGLAFAWANCSVFILLRKRRERRSAVG